MTLSHGKAAEEDLWCMKIMILRSLDDVNEEVLLVYDPPKTPFGEGSKMQLLKAACMLLKQLCE